jgi:HlyD family secretion protein
MNSKVVLTVVAIGIVALLGFGLLMIVSPRPLVFQGQVEAREVDVAAKIAGRISQVLVREGDAVSVGDVLFELDSPEIEAKMAQANATRAAAVAISDKAVTGAWGRAQSAAQLAEKTFDRFDALFNEGLISEQKHDEASTNAKAATDAARAVRAQYDMALNGARVEDKAAALAVVRQAEGLIAEVLAFAAETQLTAPMAGEVAQVLIDPGELAPTGFPVITLVDLSDAWMVLNVREDHLVNFQMNATHIGTVPALGDRRIELSVFYIAPLAAFATWRATRYSSGYDIKTFEVKLRPSEVIDGLRPGMSVLLALD